MKGAESEHVHAASQLWRQRACRGLNARGFKRVLREQGSGDYPQTLCW